MSAKTETTSTVQVNPLHKGVDKVLTKIVQYHTDHGCPENLLRNATWRVGTQRIFIGLVNTGVDNLSAVVLASKAINFQRYYDAVCNLDTFVDAPEESAEPVAA